MEYFMAEVKTIKKTATTNTKRRKKPYIIVWSAELDEFESLINKLILQSYQPHGSLQIKTEDGRDYFYQPMVLKAVFKQA
jgi:hypothetical protein